MTTFSEVNRALAQVIVEKTLQVLPSLTDGQDVAKSVEHVLGDTKFIFRPNTSLGIAASHALLDWPTSDEMTPYQKMELAYRSDSIVKNAVDGVVESIAPVISQAQSKFHFDIGADARTLSGAVESLVSEHATKGGSTKECEVVAFDWGALNRPDVSDKVSAYCQSAYKMFETAVQRGDSRYSEVLFNKAREIPFTQHRDKTQVVTEALENLTLGLDSQTLGKALTSPNASDAMARVYGAVEGITKGTPLEIVQGVTTLSKLYDELELVSASSTINETFPELKENIDSLKACVLYGLGAGMIVQNSPLNNELVLSYTPEKIVVNGTQFDAESTVFSLEALVDTAYYLNAHHRLSPTSTLSEKTVERWKDKAHEWKSQQVAASAAHSLDTNRAYHRDVLRKGLSEWADTAFNRNAPSTLPNRLSECVSQVVNGKKATIDAVMTFMVDVKSDATTKAYAHNYIAAMETLSPETATQGELYGAVTTILGRIVNDKFANPVH